MTFVKSAGVAAPLWAHRFLFAHIFMRELRGRYIGTLTGAFWALIHPAVLLAIYAFVFAVVFKVRLPELGNGSFIAFVAVALWPWLAIQESVLRATNCVQANAALVRKVAFPHETLVFGTVSATFVVHLAGYALVLLLLRVTGTQFHFSALPTAAILLAILAFGVTGVALLTSALQVFVRDTEHILNPVFGILFYLTPVLYPLRLVPESMRYIVQLNPIAYICERLRAVLLADGALLTWGDVAAAAIAALLLFLGLWVFRRLSAHFEDFV